MLVKTFVNGLSFADTGGARSIGPASLFVRSLPGNPMDVSRQTGVTLLRYLLKVGGVSLPNKRLGS